MIHHWFPKTIYYKNNIEIENLCVYRNSILDVFKSNTSCRDGLKNVDSTYMTVNNLQTNSNFDSLVNIILEEVSIYAKEIGFLNRNYYIDSMWANVSKENDYLFPHNHNGSFISGVFYISSNLENKIKFFNSPTMFPDPDIWNKNNFQYCEYSCIPGTLLLFQSDIMHGTESQVGSEKICLSFNICMK